MEKIKMSKIKRAKRIGGIKFAIFTGAVNVIRKVESFIISFINWFKYIGQKEIIRDIDGFKMILNPKGKGIQKQLLTNGDREVLARNIFRKELRKGDIVLEAGANMGHYLFLETEIIGKDGMIYAVEPSKKNYEILGRNLELNDIGKITNVKKFNFAFGDRNKEVSFEISPAINMNRVIEKEPRFSGKIEKIEMFTIDKFLEKMRKPTVVRMDVEGDEYLISKGMKGLLKNSPPRLLYIETHFKAMGDKRTREFLTNLKKNGYEIKHCISYETATSKIPFLNYLDKKRLALVNKKVTINDLLEREYDTQYPASLEIFFEYKDSRQSLKNK